MNEQAEAERTIYLPQPEGHRRGSLRFINGLMIPVDASPEELADLVDDFIADPDRRRLELRDAQFGEPYYLLRPALEQGHLLAIAVEWVKNPAPELGARKGVVVAREMPEQQRLGRRRLH